MFKIYIFKFIQILNSFKFRIKNQTLSKYEYIILKIIFQKTI